MTTDRDDLIIGAVLQREGGYTDDPADRGGPTNFGITQATLAQWRGRPVSADDVRTMTEAEARTIYADLYLSRTGIGRIANDDVRAVVFDAAVNHGAKPAIRLLQRALGLHDDGVIGPVTLSAIPYLDGRRLAVRVLAERCRLYGRLISGNTTDADRDGIPDSTEFAAGWLNRVAAQLEELVL